MSTTTTSTTDNTPPPSPTPRAAGALGDWTVMALWVLLWGSLATGYGDLVGLLDVPSIAGVRSAVPLLVFAIAGILLATRMPDPYVGRWGPTLALAFYGFIGLAAGFVFSVEPIRSTYWVLVFLAVPLTMGLVSLLPGNPVQRNARLLRLTYALVAVVLALLLAQAILYDRLLEQIASGEITRFHGNFEGDRGRFWVTANGIARFAAILGLVALARILSARDRKPSPLMGGLWGGTLAVALVLLYLTISRGAILGFGAGALVLLGVYHGQRVVLWSMALGSAGLLAGGLAQGLLNFLRRGQGVGELLSFTGRTDLWDQALALVTNSPIVGLGFHSDRILLDGHVHNAWIHALLQAGIVGLLLFAAAWAWAWFAYSRAGLGEGFRSLTPGQRVVAAEATAILMFLLVRSIPESSGAFFGVDLLLLAPVLSHGHVLLTRHPHVDPRAVGEPGTVSGSPGGSYTVLACAYACAPPGTPTFHGGEELLGWRLVNEVARRNEIHVLTSQEHRASIEARAEEIPETIHFHYVGLPRWMDGLRERAGGIQLYAYLWQIAAYRRAKQLAQAHDFDLYHHITYANDWMASHTGALLDIPFVRGPAGGVQRVPSSLAKSKSMRFRAAQATRTLLQTTLRCDPFFQADHARASALLPCNPEVHAALPPAYQAKSVVFPVNGIDPPPDLDPGAVDRANGFHVVSAGKLLAIKGFDLALDAFAGLAAATPDARLTILGDGPERATLEQQAADLGITDKVTFEGWVEHEEVLERMSTADAFLFPSMRDGGGAVVVEAMAAGTPVVCLNLGGPALHVTDEIGFRIEPSDPESTARELSTALIRLAGDAKLREQMGLKARERAIDHYSWSHQGDRLQRIYTAVLNAHRDHHSTRRLAR